MKNYSPDSPWSFYGVDCTKAQADQWRAKLASNRCPFCNRFIRKIHNNIARHIRACPERPKQTLVEILDMEVATHTGKRLKVRGECEKCGTPTNWVVDIMGRVGAFWCGCGNSDSLKKSNSGHGIDKPIKTNE